MFSISFNFNAVVNLVIRLKVLILEALYRLSNRFGFWYKYACLDEFILHTLTNTTTNSRSIGIILRSLDCHLAIIVWWRKAIFWLTSVKPRYSWPLLSLELSSWDNKFSHSYLKWVLVGLFFFKQRNKLFFMIQLPLQNGLQH